MPTRQPKGTYRRTTGDWFQHSRFWVTHQIASDSNFAGLINGDQSGRICHVLGVNVAMYWKDPTFAEYYVQGFYFPNGVVPGTLIAGSLFSTVAPFFDQDPLPNVTPIAGEINADGWPVQFPVTFPIQPTPTFSTPIMDTTINYATGSFYPEGGIAAFRAMRGFGLMLGDWSPENWVVTFDCVMLSD
jgi:hypothetical protein